MLKLFLQNVPIVVVANSQRNLTTNRVCTQHLCVGKFVISQWCNCVCKKAPLWWLNKQRSSALPQKRFANNCLLLSVTTRLQMQLATKFAKTLLEVCANFSVLQQTTIQRSHNQACSIAKWKCSDAQLLFCKSHTKTHWVG